MQTPKNQIQTSQKTEQTKPEKKKEGKIQQVWEMNQKGSSVKDIAKKTGLTEKVIRSYIWRKQNPEKFKALLKRYQEKRKKKFTEKTNKAGPKKETKSNLTEKV